MSRPLDRQYQAAVEVVLPDAARLGATSQLDDEVSALFLPEPANVLV